MMLLTAIALSFSISTGVRLLEFPKWDRADMKVNDEPILASNDAYAWLSEASSAEVSATLSPMGIFARSAASVFRSSPAEVAFWAPVFLASLLTVPLVLWAVLLGAPGAAILIATVGSLVPAYLTRSRIGFYDTDWAILFFPILISFLLAAWLRPQIRPSKSGKSRSSTAGVLIGSPLAAILVILLGMPWHSFIGTFVVISMSLVAGLIFFLAPPTRRTSLIWVTIAISVAALWGWAGAVVGIAIILGIDKWKAFRRNRWAERIGTGLLVLLLFGMLLVQNQAFLLESIDRYLDLLPSDGSESNLGFDIVFPASGLSLAELQDVTLMNVWEGMAFFWWLGLLGTFLFCLLIWREPVSILLAPLVLLGYASVQLGSRFAIFGGPVLMLAAIVPIEWLIRTRRSSRNSSGILFFTLSAFIVLFAAGMISRETNLLPAQPVLQKEHAEALIELGNRASGQGHVWTWWDYGHATRYYTGLDTFADGSRNTGPYLFVLGKVLTETNLEVARDLVTFSASTDNRPWEWMQRQGLDAFYQALEDGALPALEDHQLEAQYVVVQWEMLSSLPWITYYGAWDFENEESKQGIVSYLTQQAEVNTRSGELGLPGGRSVYLASVDLMGTQKSQHHEFEHNPTGLHLLINSAIDEAALLDDAAYYSTAVQLLIRSPEEFTSASPFQLVIDGAPHVRIFQTR